MSERIVISDSEIPEAIRGSWTGQALLRNGILVSFGKHSDEVADVLEGFVVRSGATTKQAVLTALGELASLITQPS